MENKKYLKLNDIEAYKCSFQLSNQIWNIVIKWDHLSKDTIGKQFIRSVDSISANIAEASAVITKKIRFYFIDIVMVQFMNPWTGMRKQEPEI
jgi:hypothetical protein